MPFYIIQEFTYAFQILAPHRCIQERFGRFLSRVPAFSVRF